MRQQHWGLSVHIGRSHRRVRPGWCSLRGVLASGLAVIVLLCSEASAAECEPDSERHTIEFEGRQWVTNLARKVTVEEYQGTTALCVRGRHDAYVYLADVELQDGTIEVDIATEPRSTPGIAFRGRDGGNWCDKILLARWMGTPRDNADVVEQVVFTRRNGTLGLLRVRVPVRDGVGGNPDLYEWFHVKVAFRGREVKVYLNGSQDPCVEVGSMFDEIGKGTLGVCGTDFYFANFRYTASERVAAHKDRPTARDALTPE
jgi:hypothetical protein